MYSEQDLDNLIKDSVLNAIDMPYISTFSKTESGLNRIIYRVKQHVLVRGITNLDTALGLVETELSLPNTQD